jgi:dephospho-CoA kinase
MNDLNVTSFYIKVPEQERLIRMLKRKDDTLECFRRVFSDQGVFQNIEQDADYVLDGCEDTGTLTSKIINIVKGK